MIVIILWYLSILLSWGWGYISCLTRNKRRTRKAGAPDESQLRAELKAQRESENFWSYDGTEQD